MNFVADENVDGQIVHVLRQDGHTVFYTAEFAAGISDAELLDSANASQAILITSDKDFGELVYRLKQTAHGVLLLRLFGLSADAKAQQVSAAIINHGADLPGSFSVLTPGAIRIRKTI
jgi:predicted nuclease of predicted toxin-antitoxin system